MRKLTSFLLISFLLLAGQALAGQALAGDFHLECDPVDFAEANSDPAYSGYRWYESMDEGTTKTLLGDTDSLTPSFALPHDSLDNICFFATAFNQFSESEFSEAACAKAPPQPLNMRVLLQQLISFLQSVVDAG